ncbi:hypothetical protein [Paracoccus binzhouensis]|uniref:hypothetical protein n=1 Tax=Paracoccus binzhouensis TaxID=2796149 RepID=UPI0018EEF85E|nr:hypothetical protein [Paracoccus binzhouensis]
MAQWPALNGRGHSRQRIRPALSHGQGTADREHRQVLAAHREGDAEKAGTLLHAHVMGACSSLLHHVPAGRGKRS